MGKDNDIVLKQPSDEMFALIDIDALEPNDGQLDGLPANPREIEDDKFELLKENIRKYPKFLQYNMLKVYNIGSNNNNKYIIIGGNMRFLALKELGFKKVPCAIFPKDTPTERLQAYAMLDNVGFGKWDWKVLQESWDETKLPQWGMDELQETDTDYGGFFNQEEQKPKVDDKITITIPEKICFDKENIKNDVSQFIDSNYVGCTIR